MKKLVSIFIILSLVLIFSCTTTTTQQPPKTFHLVILHTNDHHGHPVKFFKYPAPDVGGLPARATLVQQIRSEEDNVLVLDAGDLNTGRPESNFFNAKPDIIGYNYIGYDAMAIGNHEFDHPLNILRDQMEEANFPFLSANVKTKDGKYLGKPYIIKDFNGVKVAIFGLTTKETEVIGNPDNIKGLVFEDEVAVAKKLVPELRKKADIVIALVHLGIYDSMNKGSKRLAKEVPGIDVIVDGHTHTKLDFPIMVKNFKNNKTTLIVQAWCWGLVVGRLDLWYENGRLINFRFKNIPINLKTREKKPDGTKVYHFIGKEIKEDKTLLAKLQPFVDKVEKLLSKVVGEATGLFSNKMVRYQETALGDLVADSMLWYAKEKLNIKDVDFAIQNGGGIRADIPAGKITKKLIYSVLPFDNSVMVMTLKGSDVQALFNYILTIKRGKGAFPQVSEGVKMTIDYVNKKITVTINGKPIDPNRTYKIATNSYLAAGGDGYKMFKNAVDKYDSSMMQRDVFIEYIKYLGGKISPVVKGRITLVLPAQAFLPLRLAA